MGSSSHRASSPYHLGPRACHDGAQHGGVAIFLTRVILTAEDSGLDKALVVCKQPKGAGLETDESAIRAINLSKSDTGQTDHQAAVILKPTGEEDEQLTYLCADPSLATSRNGRPNKK